MLSSSAKGYWRLQQKNKTSGLDKSAYCLTCASYVADVRYVTSLGVRVAQIAAKIVLEN